MTPLTLPRGLPLRWRGVAAVLAVVLAASALLDPARVAAGPVLCAFRRLTGLPCPGCGLTRSFVATAHGQVAAGFVAHPFGPLLLLACIFGLFAALRAGWGGRRVVLPGPAGLWRRLGGTLVLTWLAWAVGRVFSGLG